MSSCFIQNKRSPPIFPPLPKSVQRRIEKKSNIGYRHQPPTNNDMQHLMHIDSSITRDGYIPSPHVFEQPKHGALEEKNSFQYGPYYFCKLKAR